MPDQATIIERNLYFFYKSLASSSGLPAQTSADSIMLNAGAGLWPALIYSRASAQLPNLSPDSPGLLIAEGTTIQDKDPVFRQMGFRPFSAWKGMMLDEEPPANSLELPASVVVVKVETSLQAADWMELVNAELLSADKIRQPVMDCLLAIPGMEAWLLLKNGIAVSTMLVFECDESVGLYFISTRKAFRKQGFGSLLVKLICHRVAGNSEKPVVLHATSDGEKVYPKLGFRPYNHFYLYRKIKL